MNLQILLAPIQAQYVPVCEPVTQYFVTKKNDIKFIFINYNVLDYNNYVYCK